MKRSILVLVITMLLGFSYFAIGSEISDVKKSSQVIDNQSDRAKDPVDCKKIKTLNSRIKRKICLKKSEWKRLEESSQQLVREMS